MKKLEGNKLVALLLSAGMATSLLAACSVNTDQLGQGISDLGNAFNTTATEAPAVTESTVTESSAESSATTEETTAEATPTATPTATPSPTPLPQRVDFSDYTEIDLTDTFEVTVEEFDESAHSDDDTVEFAVFTGNRLVVTDADNETARDAINLLVDGFYAEAEGAYQNLVAQLKSEYLTNGVIENSGSVYVNFEYKTKGRVLSVLMIYAVSVGDKIDRTVDFVSFDMLSGHYLALNTVVADTDALEKACKNALADAIKAKALETVQPTTTATPTPTPAAVTTTTAPTTAETTVVETINEDDLPKASDFEVIYIAPTASDTEGVHKVTVIGLAKDGIIYEADVEIDSYANLFNRYGTSVFFI